MCPPQVQLINDAYNAVVDAVLGAEAEAPEGREPCAAILATLKLLRIPIVSLDVPSGPPRAQHPPGTLRPPRPMSPHCGLVTLPGASSPWARCLRDRGDPRCHRRVGTPPGTPPRPPLPGSVPRAGGRSPRLRFRASTVNNKLPELRHDVI